MAVPDDLNLKCRSKFNHDFTNHGCFHFMTFLCCHCCWSFLWCNYWRSFMLRCSTFWSYLKLIVQMQLVLYLCDQFLISNRNMTGDSVEKHCFVVLNVKLQVKLRFKTFYWLLKLLYHYPRDLFCSTFLDTVARTRTESLKPCIVDTGFCKWRSALCSLWFIATIYLENHIFFIRGDEKFFKQKSTLKGWKLQSSP